jgi:hypothetical protein
MSYRRSTDPVPLERRAMSIRAERAASRTPRTLPTTGPWSTYAAFTAPPSGRFGHALAENPTREARATLGFRGVAIGRCGVSPNALRWDRLA